MPGPINRLHEMAFSKGGDLHMTTPKALFFGLSLIAAAIIVAGIMRYSAADSGGNWQLVPHGDDQFLIFNTQDGLVAYTCHLDNASHKLDC